MATSPFTRGQEKDNIPTTFETAAKPKTITSPLKRFDLGTPKIEAVNRALDIDKQAPSVKSITGNVINPNVPTPTEGVAAPNQITSQPTPFPEGANTPNQITSALNRFPTTATEGATEGAPTPARQQTVLRALEGPDFIGQKADIQRERVRADRAQAEEARLESIERQLSASGIDDAGILAARQRGARQDIGVEAGRQLGGIDESELTQRISSEEAEKDRIANMLGIERQAETAERGQDIGLEGTLSGLETTERGQDIDARLTELGLSQEEKLAVMEIASTESGRELQAELTRLGIDADTQKAIMQNATTIRGQDMEFDLFGRKITSEREDAFIGDLMSSFKLDDPRERDQFLFVLEQVGINLGEFNFTEILEREKQEREAREREGVVE